MSICRLYGNVRTDLLEESGTVLEIIQEHTILSYRVLSPLPRHELNFSLLNTILTANIPIFSKCTTQHNNNNNTSSGEPLSQLHALVSNPTFTVPTSGASPRVSVPLKNLHKDLFFLLNPLAPHWMQMLGPLNPIHFTTAQTELRTLLQFPNLESRKSYQKFQQIRGEHQEGKKEEGGAILPTNQSVGYKRYSLLIHALFGFLFATHPRTTTAPLKPSKLTVPYVTITLPYLSVYLSVDLSAFSLNLQP